ncbi:MAG: hypothetical protein O2826_12575 [Chloroflexi bacterium]|nr:hypothetical protein [Chloroflexota bacterium]MDA1175334.1 hypothetical protein [Chloroflexota bacterium]
MSHDTPDSPTALRPSTILAVVFLTATAVWAIGFVWHISVSEVTGQGQWAQLYATRSLMWAVTFSSQPGSTAWNVLYSLFLPLATTTLFAIGAMPPHRHPGLISWATAPWLLAALALILVGTIPLASHTQRIIAIVALGTTTSGLVVAAFGTAALRSPFRYRHRMANTALLAAILIIASGLSIMGFIIVHSGSNMWPEPLLVAGWPASLALLLLAIWGRLTGASSAALPLLIAAAAIIVAAIAGPLTLYLDIYHLASERNFDFPLSRVVMLVTQLSVLPAAVVTLGAMHALSLTYLPPQRIQRIGWAAAGTILVPTLATLIRWTTQADGFPIHALAIAIVNFPLVGAIALTAAPHPTSQPH